MTLQTLASTLVILVVEDMPQMRAQLVTDLRLLNFSGVILEAENLQVAKGIIFKHKLDLVICDWNLPDGSGVDLLKEVKGQFRFRYLPFIMCTTVDEVANIINAITNGASEYIVKPWSVAELEKKIKSLI